MSVHNVAKPISKFLVVDTGISNGNQEKIKSTDGLRIPVHRLDSRPLRVLPSHTNCRHIEGVVRSCSTILLCLPKQLTTRGPRDSDCVRRSSIYMNLHPANQTESQTYLESQFRRGASRTNQARVTYRPQELESSL